MKSVAVYLSVLMMIQTATVSLCYFGVGDWRKGLYWAAATVITIAVTI